MEEIWKEIKWYENYQVSNLGNVKSLNYLRTWKEKILKPCKEWNGYLFVSFSKNKKVKMYKIHRLVAIAFIDNPLQKPQVNHINWIKTDNRLENLEFNTASENQLHRFRELGHKVKHWKDNHLSKKVNQYWKDGNFIKSWDCAMDIQRQLWIHQQNIWKCCNWKYKTAGGFNWKFNI